MPLHFTKMHGLGNDYVFISLFDQAVDRPAELAQRMSDRHRGVGSDGLILVGPAQAPEADARMTMYNADGSRAEMCGNGIRCVGKLLYERGVVSRTSVLIETDAGLIALELCCEGAHVTAVRVDMGPPKLVPAEIPVIADGPRAVGVPLELPDQVLSMTCVSMGNPHAVVFVDNVTGVPLYTWGPQVEHHRRFPRRTNAHFAQPLSRDRIRMITWERGAGATQACGTGAAAVCVAGVLNGLVEPTVTVELPGGELRLEWDRADRRVFMTGPAEEVFAGVWQDNS